MFMSIRVETIKKGQKKPHPTLLHVNYLHIKEIFKIFSHLIDDFYFVNGYIFL